MMNVLFVHNTLPEYRIDFFRRLSERVQLSIVLTDEELAKNIYGLSSEVKNDIDVRTAKSPGEICKIIKDKTFDVVVLPPIDTLYQFRCAISVIRICKTNHIKTICWSEKWEAKVSLQPLLKRLKNTIHSMMIGFVAKRATCCIAAGMKSKEFFLNVGIEESKVFIAYDSSTSPEAHVSIDIYAKYGIPLNSKIVLFLGRLIERKGIMLLLQAFEKMQRKEPNAYLLICGDGDMLRQCKRYLVQNKVSKVVMAGKIEPAERSDYYRQSDVFVLPSYSYKGIIEAWGLTVNEALEQGTPVVATDAVGAAYDIANGSECVMIPEDNIEYLANSICSMLSKEKNSVDCKKLYNQFSVENMAQQFTDALFTLK